MLSYRHAFHAGNFADVLKHSVLRYVLEYMTKKDKGFSYIDTHSGAGMYQLYSEYAQKTGEYKQGIALLTNQAQLPELLNDYVLQITQLNQLEQHALEHSTSELAVYPGSPGIAKAILRKQDNAKLFELHNTDVKLLEEYCQNWRQATVLHQDGYKGLQKQLPPPTRRAVVLIDPPYEIKTDYPNAVDAIINGYKKFATGTYILWYPVVNRHYIDAMEQQFKASTVKNVLQVELLIQPDSDGYGMTGTGLFIVNPPWQLNDLLAESLPELVKLLGNELSTIVLRQLIAE
ncbi:23S rRNA (adenine(2030)-N(6))-methyltransferase RlmJ [Colwellia sp. MEBiC06753]